MPFTCVNTSEFIRRRRDGVFLDLRRLRASPSEGQRDQPSRGRRLFDRANQSIRLTSVINRPVDVSIFCTNALLRRFIVCRFVMRLPWPQTLFSCNQAVLSRIASQHFKLIFSHSASTRLISMYQGDCMRFRFLRFCSLLSLQLVAMTCAAQIAVHSNTRHDTGQQSIQLFKRSGKVHLHRHKPARPQKQTVSSPDALPGWDAAYTGTATYTGSGYTGGAVLLDPIAPDAEIAALNPYQMQLNGIPAALAGAYLEVTGPRGKTTVYVTDLYPEGASGGLDLSPNAFAKIGDMAAGRIPIQWHVVAAPINGPVVFRLKEGSSIHWAAIQVRNSVYPVMKLEVKQGDGWRALAKTPYNHFEGRDLGNEPLVLRLTNIRGEQRIDVLAPLHDQALSQPVLLSGQVQFTP